MNTLRTSTPVAYRLATEGDLPGQHGVFVAAEGALLERHRFPWTPPPLEALASGLRHNLATDPDRCWVAEVAGRVIGYGGAWVRGTSWFLSSLFIHPDHQGRGIGRRLLELSSRDAPIARMTISDSIQPISNALYASHGLLPTTPILAFQGRATVKRPADLEAVALGPGDLARLDQAAYGFDRAVDHAYWQTRATLTGWARNGVLAAYAYRWPSGRIGPIAGADPAAAAAALAAVLTAGGECYLDVPGTSRALVMTALGAGLRLQSPPGMLLLSDGIDPPTALAISGYGLM